MSARPSLLLIFLPLPQSPAMLPAAHLAYAAPADSPSSVIFVPRSSLPVLSALMICSAPSECEWSCAWNRPWAWSCPSPCEWPAAAGACVCAPAGPAGECVCPAALVCRTALCVWSSAWSWDAAFDKGGRSCRRRALLASPRTGLPPTGRGLERRDIPTRSRGEDGAFGAQKARRAHAANRSDMACIRARQWRCQARGSGDG